jgi:hypothetical protein
MSSDQRSLEEIVRELPPDLRERVRQFAETLQVPKNGGGKLTQNWAGALSDCRDEYTSLELQKKALDWRGD